MIDTNELRRLAQAASEWSNCNQAWLDQSEDVPAATVGHIDEDGNTYPIATIDCDQYYAAHQSLPLAKFYAAANPATINELLDRLEAAEKSDAESLAMYRRARDERDALHVELNEIRYGVAVAHDTIKALRAKIAEMERQEPVMWANSSNINSSRINRERGGCGDQHTCSETQTTYHDTQLYALPGAKGEEK